MQKESVDLFLALVRVIGVQRGRYRVDIAAFEAIYPAKLGAKMIGKTTNVILRKITIFIEGVKVAGRTAQKQIYHEFACNNACSLSLL